MTIDRMRLQELIETGSDADLLKETLSFLAQGRQLADVRSGYGHDLVMA